jgi:hypothetical protein
MIPVRKRNQKELTQPSAARPESHFGVCAEAQSIEKRDI